MQRGRMTLTRSGNTSWVPGPTCPIKRNDRMPIHDWRHLQQIKNDICGEDREAVELYPATDRVNDGANQYHLWVLPKGKRMAIGSPLRIVMSEKEALGYAPGAKQRPFQEGLSI